MVRWTPLLVAVIAADAVGLVMVWAGIFQVIPSLFVWVGAGLVMFGMWGFGKHQEQA